MLDGPTGAARLRASRDLLRELMTVMGTDGMAAAAARPGLGAAVDQHAAAVRDSITGGQLAPSLLGLAGYAEGMLHAMREAGWRLPCAADIDWPRADWRVVRMLAVCALAVGEGHV